MSKDKKVTKNEQDDNKKMPFGRDNYLWVLIGIAFLLVGFILMIGGGSDNPDAFNEPILVLIGFGIEIYAIMKKPKDE